MKNYKTAFKSIVAMAALAMASVSVSAADIGLRASRNSAFGGDAIGFSIGAKPTEKFGLEGYFDRSVRNGLDTNKITTLGTYDVAKVGPVTFAAKAGGAYVNSSSNVKGYAVVGGVGASYSLTKNVSLVADYSYQRGQKAITNLNGSNYSVGVKYAF